MTTPESRTPAIAGVSQIVQRPEDVPLDARRGPIELMIDAARRAAADAGAPALLDQVGFVGVVGGWWRYHNPGQLVAEAIGVPGAATMLTGVSGTSPQDVVAIAAERIARGQLDVALVLGGEARWSHQRIKRDGGEPHWNSDPGDREPERLSGFPDAVRAEGAFFGGAAPMYALFEDRLRVVQEQTVDAHRTRIAELWAHFSEVAAGNEHAWDRTVHGVDEIRDPRPDNRMISFPYTKAMVANNTVDMATAILLCSADSARRAGVASDRLVFPLAIANSRETWLIAERRELDGSPALAAAARAAFTHAGLGLDDIEHIDLYACFPSMVEMSAAALGIDPGRELTITGGLGFAGAPVGNAVGHSIAAMVERVRSGGEGLVHGNGGSATKQSFGIYSRRPPTAFARIDVQELIDLRPRTPLPHDWSGPVVVEAATVRYDRAGPDLVLATVLDDTGRRAYATTDDAATFAAAESAGIAGLAAHRTADGRLHM